MPVCITGMHRSGTSLVANLLYRCGLFLGDEQDLMPATTDNENGYRENEKFQVLNDEVLGKLGGAWDFPPAAPAEGYRANRLAPLRVKAEILLKEFYGHEPWGWKDPRNCLTLPFWIGLGSLSVPFWYGFAEKLKVVLCVRNPFEVFRSLDDRKYGPSSAGFKLWLLYNRSLLNYTLPEDRIVTHYEAYFPDARSELRRILTFLNMRPSDEVIERASLAVSSSLRHQRFDEERLRDAAVDSEILTLYQDLCQEAEFAEPSGICNLL
jgi:hypothetical protein